MKWQEVAGLLSAMIAIMSVTFFLNTATNERIVTATQFVYSSVEELRDDAKQSIRFLWDYMIEMEIRIREMENESWKRKNLQGPDADIQDDNWWHIPENGVNTAIVLEI